MNRQQKEAVVVSLQTELSTSAASFVVNIQGLTVEQFETLRTDLRSQKGKLQVAKVRLMKRALEGTDCAKGLAPYMGEQIALVFAQEEPTIIAKAICTFAKANEAFKVLAGCMESQILDAGLVEEIALLPTRDVLLAQLVGTLQAPYTLFAMTLERLLIDFTYVLSEIERKKQ
jgi:large subunit ribosomal protein L10